jgi:sugar lactone lactonase YvrE
VLDGPSGLAEDAEGNVYISESNAGVIRRVRPDGIIERFAGSGVIGDGPEGRPALETSLSSPTHLLMDRDGGLIFADAQTCRIRKVQLDGTIQNLVGTGSCTPNAFGFGGSGNKTRLGPETQVSGIGGMVLDSSGRLVFTEQNNHLIRRLDSDGFVRTIAGTGAAGFSGDDDAATWASFRYPAGLAYDSSGNLYVGDGTNCRIRRIDTEGNIRTVAGTGACASSATSFAAGNTSRALGRIGALAYEADSNSLFIAFPAVYRVARLELDQSRLVPFLGNGRLGASDTKDPATMNLNEPSAILVSVRGGVLVAAGTSFQVYRVQDGVVQSFAGRWPQLDAYPPALSAPLVRPAGLSFDPDGSLLIIDTGAARLLQFQDPDQVSAIAGARYPTGFSQGDNGPALEAVLKEPSRVVRVPTGELYISEAYRIRVIDTQGVIQTALNYLDFPTGLAFDSQAMTRSRRPKRLLPAPEPPASTATEERQPMPS